MDSPPPLIMTVQGSPIPRWLKRDLGIKGAVFHSYDRAGIGFTDGTGIDVYDPLAIAILMAWCDGATLYRAGPSRS